MLTDEQKQKLKDALRSSVEVLVSDAVSDLDEGTIHDVMRVMNSVTAGVEEDLQDIEEQKLGLRTHLIAWLLNEFDSHDYTVYSVLAKEKPMGFTIEVDIPWDPETIEDLDHRIERTQDMRLDRAWRMYHVDIDETNARMTFQPISS